MKSISKILLTILMAVCIVTWPSASEAGQRHGQRSYGYYSGHYGSHGSYGRYRGFHGRDFVVPRAYFHRREHHYRHYPYPGHYFYNYRPYRFYRGPYLRGYYNGCYDRTGYYTQFGFGF